jgi:hypothetical protein
MPAAPIARPSGPGYSGPPYNPLAAANYFTAGNFGAPGAVPRPLGPSQPNQGGGYPQMQPGSFASDLSAGGNYLSQQAHNAMRILFPSLYNQAQLPPPPQGPPFGGPPAGGPVPGSPTAPPAAAAPGGPQAMGESLEAAAAAAARPPQFPANWGIPNSPAAVIANPVTQSGAGAPMTPRFPASWGEQPGGSPDARTWDPNNPPIPPRRPSPAAGSSSSAPAPTTSRAKTPKSPNAPAPSGGFDNPVQYDVPGVIGRRPGQGPIYTTGMFGWPWRR